MKVMIVKEVMTGNVSPVAMFNHVVLKDDKNMAAHMGSSAQDGENDQYLALLFFWSFTVAKRFDFLKFRQLF